MSYTFSLGVVVDTDDVNEARDYSTRVADQLIADPHIESVACSPAHWVVRKGNPQPAFICTIDESGGVA